LKAYEARRAAEATRSSTIEDVLDRQVGPVSTVRRPRALSRAEELAIIRSDLKRLLMILALLAVVLIVLTFFLR
jgi:hypothetical protein